jgi:putative endonuclease
MNKIAVGKHGEDLAKRYLVDHGYKVVESNYYTRYGEVDIIGQKDDVYSFIEVKTRTNEAYGSPGESVDIKKQKKIILTATKYLSDHDLHDREVRFDVIEVLIQNNRFKVNHIVNAFY